MADLYHLLEEIRDTSNQDSQEIASSNAEDWEERDVVADLPPVLKEAERRKRFGEPEEEDEQGKAIDLDDILQTTKESLEDLAYHKLRSVWMQEINCPELLPYNKELMEQLLSMIEEQEQRIDSITSDGTTGNENIDDLFASLLRKDLDRLRYLLASLLKTRLLKIQEHPLHMRGYVDRMSDQEVEFLKGYGRLMESHLQRTVLDHFPQDVWKKLDEPEMIDSPNLDTYVFIRTREHVIIDGTEHPKGICLILQYSRVQNMLLDGSVEMLM